MEEEFDKELEGMADEPDEMELEDEEAASRDKIKQLRDKLRRAEQEKMAALEDLQRAKADFLNARKRLDEERVRDRERAAVDQIEQLLPLMDSFDLALADSAFADAPPNLQKGIRGIHSQLASILKGYQVTATGEPGEPFDPAQHEAVDETEAARKEDDHTVAAVRQKGYRLKDTIIRPARVTVAIWRK